MRLAGLLLGCVLGFAAPVHAGERLKIIDGDTIRDKNGERVRLRNHDAPETAKQGQHAAKCREERAAGLAAKKRLQQLVRSGNAEVKYVDQVRDKYGRRVGVLEVDGKDVGETLREKGLAKRNGSKAGWCGS